LFIIRSNFVGRFINRRVGSVDGVSITRVWNFTCNQSLNKCVQNHTETVYHRVPDALKAMGIASAPNSADIVITSPDIAENGMVVPVGVASKLAKTEMAALLVEKNPSMLAGFYEFTTDAVPDVSMRVKMGQSSDVIAIVKADGKFFMAKKEIKVTLGGCGG
jgi:sulfur-oxidizing protein SoxY